MKIDYTTEMVEEIQRCYHSPEYFIEFHLNMDADWVEEHVNAPGISHTPTLTTTQLAAYMLWFACYRLEQTVVYIGKSDKHCRATNAEVLQMYESLPQWLVPKLTVRLKHTLEFASRGAIHFCAPNINAGKGLTIHLLVIDDLSKVSSVYDMVACLAPTMCSFYTQTLIVSENAIL